MLALQGEMLAASIVAQTRRSQLRLTKIWDGHCCICPCLSFSLCLPASHRLVSSDRESIFFVFRSDAKNSEPTCLASRRLSVECRMWSTKCHNSTTFRDVTDVWRRPLHCSVHDFDCINAGNQAVRSPRHEDVSTALWCLLRRLFVRSAVQRKSPISEAAYWPAVVREVDCVLMGPRAYNQDSATVGLGEVTPGVVPADGGFRSQSSAEDSSGAT